jgi:hypothetical protein
MRKVDGDAGINRELFVLAHLLALIIGQGLRDLSRQGSECFRIGFPHRCGVFRVERDQKGIPCGAFHQGAERGALMLAKNEVTLPVAGHGAVGHGLRPLFDREHLHYFASCFLVVPVFPLSPICARLPQALNERGFQRPAREHVDIAIDCLV